MSEPYQRQDGVKTVHVAFSIPEGVATETRVFIAGLPKRERGAFVAACLREGIKKGWPR